MSRSVPGGGVAVLRQRVLPAVRAAVSPVVLPGLRAAGCGLAVATLSLTANIVLFVLAVLSLAFIPLFGLGFVFFPMVMGLVRLVANVYRGLATRMGIEILVPYRPVPDDAPIGTWRRFRHTVGDPATWLDFAWLVPGTPAGAAMGVLACCLPLFGAQWLMWLYASFAKPFLGPTKGAELALRVAHLTTTRSDALDAQAAELQRIERDLHDGAQARLVALGMNIGLAEELVRQDPVAAGQLLAEARRHSGEALAELRGLVRGIHPPVLAERGLGGAVQALALAAPLPVDADVDVPGRPAAPIESAAYFAVAETLTNITRHSGARRAWIIMRYASGRLTTVICDNGRGGAEPERGTGLRGIERRLAAFDGTMSVFSPPGGPTVVTMEVSCELSSPKTSPSSGTA